MSLILDALKKSEAERRRGLPPSLSTPFGAPRRRRHAPWVAGAGAVLLAAGLAGGWVLLNRGREGAPPDLAAVPTAPAAGESSALANSPAISAPAGVVDSSLAPMPVAVAQDSKVELQQAYGDLAGSSNGGSVSGGGLPVPGRAALFTPSTNPEPLVADAAAVAPPMAPPVIPEAAPAVLAMASPLSAPLTPPDPMPATIAPALAADPKIDPTYMPKPEPSVPQEGMLVVHQLPYALRKELPKLDMSMHVFSPERDDRFIVLNGKRFNLSSPPPGPDLNLIDILDDGAVFEFRGQRFLLPRTAY